MFLATVSHHPLVEVKLLAELNSVLGNSNTPTNTQLSREMPYLNMCVLEILRLYPPFPVVTSKIAVPVTVEGHTVPPEMEFWTSIYSMQRDPKYWGDDAHLFRPERFDSPTLNPAWIPFGSGTRRCPGERLGTFDVKYFAASMLKRFRFEITDASQLVPETCISFIFPKGLDVRAFERSF